MVNDDCLFKSKGLNFRQKIMIVRWEKTHHSHPLMVRLSSLEPNDSIHRQSCTITMIIVFCRARSKRNLNLSQSHDRSAWLIKTTQLFFATSTYNFIFGYGIDAAREKPKKLVDGSQVALVTNSTEGKRGQTGRGIM